MCVLVSLFIFIGNGGPHIGETHGGSIGGAIGGAIGGTIGGTIGGDMGGIIPPPPACWLTRDPTSPPINAACTAGSSSFTYLNNFAPNVL